ncbi:hypothetical protein LR48_Vigan02g095200 [Vigna angularis]|uniref:Uncharacterized protein n=1 Tax=Phaseolus angularis TaxID=3914 RepID=A0A0L9TWK3_PHAAN|nr:hypothetical protein LR48_Vigan02g095200 [Vigna angularis]
MNWMKEVEVARSWNPEKTKTVPDRTIEEKTEIEQFITETEQCEGGGTRPNAHEAAPFQMRDMNMSLMEERMNALYRGEQELLRTLTSAFLERQFISQEDFAARVAWLVAPSQTDDGAEAAKASTMEEEAEDEEDYDDYD